MSPLDISQLQDNILNPDPFEPLLESTVIILVSSCIQNGN